MQQKEPVEHKRPVNMYMAMGNFYFSARGLGVRYRTANVFIGAANMYLPIKDRLPGFDPTYLEPPVPPGQPSDPSDIGRNIPPD